MRALATSAISSLIVVALLLIVFVVGYGPYRFTPAPLPPDVLSAMPAEKRAEWALGEETRIRGLPAVREISQDPPMQLVLGKAAGVLWLTGFLSALAAARWLRR
jgi:hypothetical protein